MPQITKIEFHLETSGLSGAGTDGDVYLGICGREFSIDSTKDDFERNSGRTYVLGDEADTQRRIQRPEEATAVHRERSQFSGVRAISAAGSRRQLARGPRRCPVQRLAAYRLGHAAVCRQR